jgi:hypothetical protein
MTTATFRIGQVQQAALEIYVFDVAHEGDEERAIDGRLEAGKLVINGSLDSAHRALTDAANACDDDGDHELRDALTSLASRVIRHGR